MDDITVSLIVLLGAVLLAAGVFLLTRRSARQREEALLDYCEKNGLHLAVRREPESREVRITGESWQLVASMRAQQNSGDTGASGWQRETEWICLRENPLRQTFALQLSQGATDLDRLPQWVRDAAIEALRLWLGEEMQKLDSLRTAFCENGRSCVVFEQEAHAADASLEQLLLPLTQYRGSLPLYLECAPARVRLFLPDAFVASAPEAEQLLRIAKKLL